jgi:hypothetical protein
MKTVIQSIYAVSVLIVAVSIAIFLNHYQREKQTNFRCVNNTLYEQFGTGDIWTKRGFMCESFGDQK